jgi:hypothetical protein
MDRRSLVIIVEFIIITGLLIYSFNQNSLLNRVKTELDSFSNFGTSKIKLPIDMDEEAILISMTSEEVRIFKENRQWLVRASFIPSSVINDIKQKKLENRTYLSNVSGSAYIVKYWERPEMK